MTKDKIVVLNMVFSQLRYGLTRFGRIINLVDPLQNLFKKKRFAVNVPLGIQPPAIRRI